MNTDLDTAIRYALEPWTQQGAFVLCAYCGAIIHTQDAHTCRGGPLELPGVERDEKRRAKSYAIE